MERWWKTTPWWLRRKMFKKHSIVEMNSPTMPKTIIKNPSFPNQIRQITYFTIMKRRKRVKNIHASTNIAQDKKKRADCWVYVNERYPRIDYEFQSDLRKKIICKAHNSLNRLISSETFHIHTNRCICTLHSHTAQTTLQAHMWLKTPIRMTRTYLYTHTAQDYTQELWNAISNHTYL